MEREAASADYHTSKLWQKNYPRIQILTIEQLLNGAQVDMPPRISMFKKAERINKTEGIQPELI